ncbi:carboxypeptidase-like regulatory domain-containing protein [Nonlabens mediterrranea]|uniref:Carboxypeptidase-like regulatory domain-containing protein n=1 Tax=Nonlabens mediterrranea TaxID=1419947 RepID=A0ABS0A3Q8_9FLAO|nr:carboxypeptidase-like regulatory domain-containing protein [Nonlabens mediterrranea]
MRVYCLIISICFIHLYSSAQEINGRVIDSLTQEAISGASVYIDGTSKGVITDLDGYFTFNYPVGVKSALVIRMMGYETIRFAQPLKADLSIVPLVQKADNLDAVIINPDPWSRKKKEQYFKQYFLGTSPFAADCKILNLDEVKLRFNPVSGLMTARCNEPILVKNKYLGYLVSYDLMDFELQFEKRILKAGPGIIMPDNVQVLESFHLVEAFYIGSSFFQELSDKKNRLKKYKKRRDQLYRVSDLRFFRTLAANQLQEKGYVLYYDKFAVDMSNHIRVKQFETYSVIGFRHDKYPIIDAKNNRTDIYLTGEQVVIDQYGNNLSGKAIKFNGYMAELRVGGMLPLDFKPLED